MGTYKTDIHRPYIKKDHSNDPVMVSPYIKNKPVIAYCIDRIEHCFNLMIIRPISLRNQPVPVIERVFSIVMLLKKVSQSPIANDDHPF